MIQLKNCWVGVKQQSRTRSIHYGPCWCGMDNYKLQRNSGCNSSMLTILYIYRYYGLVLENFYSICCCLLLTYHVDDQYIIIYVHNSFDIIPSHQLFYVSITHVVIIIRHSPPSFSSVRVAQSCLFWLPLLVSSNYS